MSQAPTMHTHQFKPEPSKTSSSKDGNGHERAFNDDCKDQVDTRSALYNIGDVLSEIQAGGCEQDFSETDQIGMKTGEHDGDDGDDKSCVESGKVTVDNGGAVQRRLQKDEGTVADSAVQSGECATKRNEENSGGGVNAGGAVYHGEEDGRGDVDNDRPVQNDAEGDEDVERLDESSDEIVQDLSSEEVVQDLSRISMRVEAPKT